MLTWGLLGRGQGHRVGASRPWRASRDLDPRPRYQSSARPTRGCSSARARSTVDGLDGSADRSASASMVEFDAPLPRRAALRRIVAARRRRPPALRLARTGHLRRPDRGRGRRQAGGVHELPARRRAALRAVPGSSCRSVTRLRSRPPSAACSPSPASPTAMAASRAVLAPRLLWPAVADAVRRRSRAALVDCRAAGRSRDRHPADLRSTTSPRLSTPLGLFEHAAAHDPAPRARLLPRRRRTGARRHLPPARAVAPRSGPDRGLPALRRRGAGPARGASGTAAPRTGRWQDRPSVDDHWGRALWALGTAAAEPPTRTSATPHCTARDRLPARRRWPRAMAYAALGAGEVLRVRPGDRAASALLRRRA